MTLFESLVNEALLLRQTGVPCIEVSRELAALYKGRDDGKTVFEALGDPFFPLSLYKRYHLSDANEKGRTLEKAARDLLLLSRMLLRIRRDIGRYFDPNSVTCVDLGGDASQGVPEDQWCTFCGECCQLKGAIPDPPDDIRYPGYWYSYIAGDSPLRQNFCPFLFELPVQGLFFCAIHNIKPRTCLAYGEENCREKHPGKAR
ncbi:MAG: hypothetical protein JRG79_09530 [Deltaproteobacteria bacterium]|nr:hypothetical protein [Deltaproteobacteria bacterium]MBW1943093.1 hypothetical protein [Deltaproteobacteria bacterium]MBW2207138.1 hypothetical protein [Deltaproteobacteria bacterium]